MAGALDPAYAPAMRDLLIFLVLLAAVFFGVGEWQGWYLGVPTQTPILVYKKDFVAEATRRTRNLDRMPFELRGRVRSGGLTVRVHHQRAASFQAGTAAGRERALFEQSFRAGQIVAIDQVFENGEGIYRVELHFDDASGVFRMEMPDGIDL